MGPLLYYILSSSTEKGKCNWNFGSPSFCPVSCSMGSTFLSNFRPIHLSFLFVPVFAQPNQLVVVMAVKGNVYLFKQKKCFDLNFGWNVAPVTPWVKDLWSGFQQFREVSLSSWKMLYSFHKEHCFFVLTMLLYRFSKLHRALLLVWLQSFLQERATVHKPLI